MRTDKKLDSHFIESDQWRLARFDQSHNGDDQTTLWNAFETVEVNGQQKKIMNSLSGWERDNLFANTGGQYWDISGISGLDSRTDGRGHAVWDFNRDGYLDIAHVSGNNPHLQLFENRLGKMASNPSRFLAVRVVGGNGSAKATNEWSCRDGVGTIVRVTAGSESIVREKIIGEGLAAQNSPTMLIGVGDAESVDLELSWLSGKRQSFKSIACGQLVTVYENPAQSPDGSGLSLESYVRGSQSNPVTDNPAKTIPAPEVGLATKTFTPRRSSQKDAPYCLVMSMATWCSACKKHAPQAEAIKQHLGDKIALYGLPIDAADSQPMLQQYVTDHHPAYEILFDTTEAERKEFESIVSSSQLDLALPSCLLTNANGQVLATWAGLPTLSELLVLIEIQETKKTVMQRP